MGEARLGCVRSHGFFPGSALAITHFQRGNVRPRAAGTPERSSVAVDEDRAEDRSERADPNRPQLEGDAGDEADRPEEREQE